MTPTKIAIFGKTGKMGKAILEIVEKDPRYVVSETPDVWIDFSHPEGTMKVLEESKLPIVIGTTGFTEAQMAKIFEYSRRHPVLLSSNMSVGMNWIFKMLQNNPLFPGKVILEETHHDQKKDAPSGTAKSLMHILKMQDHTPEEVHSHRVGNVVGIHALKIFGANEEVTIEHRSHSRSVFAEGALFAAAAIKDFKPGLYDMKDVL